jgi:hypothetical protein
MEERRHSSNAARTRPPSTNSSLSLLQRLQSENESLRSELLRSQQKNTSLQQQLNSLRTNTSQLVKDAVSVNGEQVRALEERCRLLADRLVASKRDGQVSESARVGFLLRSQLEERRFLKRGVVGMLEALAGTTGAAAAPPLEASLADAAVGDEREEVHTGTLYRLIMAASNALLEHTASVKLAKARTRLTLEHAMSVLGEVQKALKDATRATFEAMVHASSLEEVLQAGSGAEGPPVLTMATRSTAFSHIRSGFTTPSPYCRLPTGNSVHLEGEVDVSHVGSSSAAGASEATSLHLSEELEWVCDVMKACAQGLREVDSDIATANAVLTAPPMPSPSTESGGGAEGAHSSKVESSPLSEAASPEMNNLLRSFLADLVAIKKEAARQQEEMARQLAQEVDRHYHSTLQYEERIKLLETECTRLLRYTERVAEEVQVRRSSALPAAAASAPASEPVVASSVLPQQQQQQPALSRSARFQHDDAVKPTIERPSASVTPEEDDTQENRATPERYVTRRSVTKSANPSHSRRGAYTSATASHRVGSSRRTQGTRGQHQARTAALNTSQSDANCSREVQPGYSVSSFQQERIPAPSVLTVVSPNTRLNFSTTPKSALLSPRRTTPPEATLATQSAAAAALWSRYQSRNTSVQSDASALVVDRLPSRHSQRLISPAPPPPPPPQLRTSPPRLLSSRWDVTSPRRRSATAPVPSGWSAIATQNPITMATSISSVSSTSDRFSTPRLATRAADGLLSSQIQSHAAALVSSPSATDRVAGDGAAPRAGAPPHSAADKIPAPTVSLSASPPAPPIKDSLSSSHSAHSTNRTRLTQQLYDEAAADVFSSDSTDFVEGASTPPPARQHRHQHVRSPSLGKDGESPEARLPSPRRPLHMGYYYMSHRASQDSVQPPLEQLGFTPPPSPRPLPSPPPARSTRVLASTATTEKEATPPIWRRIREEASLQQQMPSPITGTSDLFGTPQEASWMDS